jgi:transposase
LAVKKITSAVPSMTIGLDVSDQYSQLCALDADGVIAEEGRVRTSPLAIRTRFRGVERARIALEVGTHSAWIARLLTELGHEVLVANPRKLRGIYQNERKSDKVDAEWLARVARLDPKLLAPITHRGPQAQADLALVRARQAVIRTRTLLVNHVRGAVKSCGARLPKVTADAFAKKVIGAIPTPLNEALMPILQAIGTLTATITEYDKRIVQLCRKNYPHTARLSQVTGVGPITVLTYVLTLEDPDRFKKSRDVGAFLGLTTRRSQSGDRDPELRITKTGDPYLRCLLVQCAQYILGPFGTDSDLRRWGLALAERGRKNAKKRAVVAVARKLAVLLHRLWVTGDVYVPLRNGQSLSQTA